MAKLSVRNECQVQREVEDIVTDLKSTLLTKRLKAAKDLGRLKTPLGVDALREVLNDRSKEVRCAAVEALVAIRPPTLIEILAPLAEDRSADVRLRVAHGLAVLSGEQAIDMLFELVHDPREDVAAMASRSLAKVQPPPLARLIRLLGDKNWKVRRRGCEALRGLGPIALEGLKLALVDQDANMRFWAATTLGRLRDKTVVKELLAHLEDSDVGVRIAVLRALREIGDPSVVGRIFASLSQPNEQVREAIYDILKDFGTHSIPYLMESLSTEYWMGRSLAARALSEMGGDAVMPLSAALESEDKERRYWAIKILGQMKEASAFAEIKKFVNDTDSEIRMAAVEALGDFRHPEGVPLLIGRFTDPSWVVRKEAAAAIIRYGDSVGPALIGALGSVEEDVRFWALRCLGKLKPIGLVSKLVMMLRDRSWTIRKTASEVLASLGEDALMELSELATEADSEVRYWVIQSLGRIGSQHSLPLLFRSLDDPSESIRSAAQKALANYGGGVLDDLLAMLKSDRRRLLESVVATLQRMPLEIILPRLLQHLGKLDEHLNYWLRRALACFGKDARPHVLKMTQNKADEVRRQALLLLAKVGRPEDAEMVLARLKDEYWPARVAAAETLGQLGSPASVDALSEALEDEDEDLALAAARSLGQIGDDRAVPGLLFALTRESWTIRVRVVEMLGQMRVKRAIPDLLRLLTDDTMGMRTQIVRALGQIGEPECLDPILKALSVEADAEIRVSMILALGDLGDVAAAPTVLEYIKASHPWEERRAAVKVLGLLRYVEAQQPLMQLIKDPEPLISREAMASLRQIMPPADYDKLDKALTAARRRQEQFQEAFQDGMRQMRQGAVREAEESLKKAIRINPKSAYPFSALGNLFYKQGRLIDATKAYTMAVKVEPRDVNLRLNLAMVYYRRRAWREAKEAFTAVVQMTPANSQQNTYARRMLERLITEAKDQT